MDVGRRAVTAETMEHETGSNMEGIRSFPDLPGNYCNMLSCRGLREQSKVDAPHVTTEAVPGILRAAFARKHVHRCLGMEAGEGVMRGRSPVRKLPTMRGDVSLVSSCRKL